MNCFGAIFLMGELFSVGSFEAKRGKLAVLAHSLFREKFRECGAL